MTSTTVNNSLPSPQSRSPLSISPWVWLSLLAALFVALHWVYLLRMFRIATGSGSADWSHALFVPVISLYYIFLHRHQIAKIPIRIFWPGLLVMFAGLFSFAWWIYPGRNDMLQGYSMILTLLGMGLFLTGLGRMKYLWFPIVFLGFGVKVSDRIWEQIAWTLQLIAAKCAAIALSLIGVTATVTGSTITLSFTRAGVWVNEKLNVAEACSGLRMLMAFLALGTAMAFFSPRAWWQRLGMVLLAVPVAVGVNVIRVTVLGLLYLINPKMVEGDFHKFIGLLMLLPAAGLFWLVGWTLEQIIIEDEAARLAGSVPASDGSAIAPAPNPIANASAEPSLALPANNILTWPAALALGAILMLLIGLDYTLALSSFKPQLLKQIIGHQVNQFVIISLFGVGAILLVALIWKLPGYLPLNKLSTPKFNLSGSAVLSPAFALIVGILACATLGLDLAVNTTKAVLIKEAVPLREPLFTMPRRMGSWHQEGEDEQLTDDMIDQLGTRQYISRIYADQSLKPSQPGRLMRLHVAYYTGTPDTVPHVPERCYVAAGVAPLSKSFVDLTIHPASLRAAGAGWITASAQNAHVFLPTTQMPMTIFSYNSGGNAQINSNVLYCFAANGKFLATPDQVRLLGFDPRDRYSYYCKIEVGALDVADASLASERATALLSAALPEIMARLPDWNEVTAGKWPIRK